MKGLGLNLALILAVGTASVDAAVPGRLLSDDQIVARAQLVGSGKHVEIYQHGVTVDPSFLKVMESVYGQVEALTGLKLDTDTLAPKVRVYVSDAVRISHVWRGYEHPSDPKAIIFLNPRAYQGAMSSQNATHIHELTHLFTWRFNSHTLREGFADYVALTILPGAAVGPNLAGDSPAQIPTDVLDHLGTTNPAPEWVSTDPVGRRAYYFASYRLVKYLVEMKGLATFMKLYASENPEVDIRSLYGISREEAIRAALGRAQ